MDLSFWSIFFLKFFIAKCADGKIFQSNLQNEFAETGILQKFKEI